MVGAPRKSPESGRRTTSKRCKRAGDIHSAIELHTSNAFLVSANHQGLSGSKKYDKEAEEEWSKFHRGGEGSTAPRPRPSGLQISNSKLTAWKTLILGGTLPTRLAVQLDAIYPPCLSFPHISQIHLLIPVISYSLYL